MTPADLSFHVHKEILRLHRLQTRLQSPGFRATYADLNPDEQAQVARYVVSLDLEALDLWLEEHKSLSQRSVPQLRDLARRVKIKDYNLLPKHLLIQGIQDAAARRTSRVDKGISQVHDRISPESRDHGETVVQDSPEPREPESGRIESVERSIDEIPEVWL